MEAKKIIIKNEVGLHARPASLFVKEAKRYSSTVRIKYNEKEVNGKSILEILTLGADQGKEIEIIAYGEDEKKAVKALCKQVENYTE